jgi:hypothetical protein
MQTYFESIGFSGDSLKAKAYVVAGLSILDDKIIFLEMLDTCRKNSHGIGPIRKELNER